VIATLRERLTKIANPEIRVNRTPLTVSQLTAAARMPFAGVNFSNATL